MSITRQNLRRKNTKSFRPLLETLEHRRVLAAISGTVFHDADGDLFQGAEEAGIAGVRVYLDHNQNDQWDVSGFVVEPDAFEDGEELDNAFDGITLSIADSSNQPTGNVTTSRNSLATTGERVFSAAAADAFSSNRRLRIDFETPGSSVEIDIVSGVSTFAEEHGILEVYDANDQLLDSYESTGLIRGETETLRVSRSTDDIAYAIVMGPDVLTPELRLDYLRVNSAESEQSTVSDSNGDYQLLNLDPGSYTVNEIVPEGYEQTFPQNGDGSQGIAVFASQERDGVRFGNITSSVQGTVYREVGDTGVFEAGVDTPISDAIVYIDANGNGQLDTTDISVEPDDFADGTILDRRFPGVTLAGANSDNVSVVSVTAATEPFASTGTNVIGNDQGNVWSDSRRLRIDFEESPTQVSIDFTAGFDGDQASILVYDLDGNLMTDAGNSSAILDQGATVRLLINRANRDIGHLIVSADGAGRLDNLLIEGIPTEAIERSDADGAYEFTPIVSGDYVIDVVAPRNTVQTQPTGGSRSASPGVGATSVSNDFGFQLLSNTPPITNMDDLTVDEDTSDTVDVLANDSDVDGLLDPSSLQISADPVHGRVSIVDGGIRYTPDADFSGDDTFRYTVRDDLGVISDPTIVRVTVVEINDAPRVSNDQQVTEVDASVPIFIIRNDVDVDGEIDVATLRIVSTTENGTISENLVTGVVTYTPNAGFMGVDSFEYAVSDNLSAESSVARVNIFVGVEPLSWHNFDNPLDVSNDGFVAPNDILRVINELNLPTFHDPTGLLVDPPNPVPSFFDVDDDGFISPRDALLILNELNRTAAPVGAVAATMDVAEAETPESASLSQRELSEISVAAYENIELQRPSKIESIDRVLTDTPTTELTALDDAMLAAVADDLRRLS